MTQSLSPFAVTFETEVESNRIRASVADGEPHSLRTFTPSQAVLARSAGVFHWTPEGRRLYDYTSGVLVANLGHNPRSWLQRFVEYLGWDPSMLLGGDGFVQAVPLTAYNAITPVEARATERLLANLQVSDLGQRLQNVLWAASGSEAVQKALWACMQFNPERPMIAATRFGFHGKKGLATAVTGSEADPERDPRVRFISFPMADCSDMQNPDAVFDASAYRMELEQLWNDTHGQIGTLITEPYLGGGGSYHPPREYLQLLQSFCNEHDILFILDEVQSNFGRTGSMYAFESYGIEPDFVCLGKGLGNGVPVSAAVGRRDVCERMGYGATSDTWSANPLSSAAVLATLDEFESGDILEHTREMSQIFKVGLLALKQSPAVCRVRGEGMVFGVECAAIGQLTANQTANAVVERCYLGNDNNDGIHLLGPLAGCVLRVSPPMCISRDDALASLKLLSECIDEVTEQHAT
jgi:4-aminobutyrate aminotransferase-like enzyme